MASGNVSALATPVRDAVQWVTDYDATFDYEASLAQAVDDDDDLLGNGSIPVLPPEATVPLFTMANMLFEENGERSRRRKRPHSPCSDGYSLPKSSTTVDNDGALLKEETVVESRKHRRSSKRQKAAASTPLLSSEPLYASVADETRRPKGRHPRSQKRKHKNNTRKTAARRETRRERDAMEYTIREGLEVHIEKTSKRAEHHVNIDLGSVRVAQGAYIGVDNRLTEGSLSLQQLKDLGFKVLMWQANKVILLVDKRKRIIGVITGPPARAEDWTQVVDNASEAIDAAEEQMHFGNDQHIPRPPGRRDKKCKHGTFRSAAYGISYGGGQKYPKNLGHSMRNDAALKHLVDNEDIQRLLCHGSATLAYYAPKIYTDYRDTLKTLLKKCRGCTRPVRGSIFPCISINFGPEAFTLPHNDYMNAPAGMCCIQSLGDFDHTQGGHLVLHQLGLVIEFPSGSTALIPSSFITHGNVPTRKGEERRSLVQYMAGGISRWVAYGGQTWNSLRNTNERVANAIQVAGKARWQGRIDLFSNVTSLNEDHRALHT